MTTKPKQTHATIYPIGRCNSCMSYYHKNDRTDNEGICRTCGKNDALMDMPELAAAADLLIACQNLVYELVDGQNVPSLKAMEIIHKAIAKAEGN